MKAIREGGVVKLDHLHNFMEEFVLSMIEDVLSDTDICTCDLCKLDIAAVALNNLPPKYFVTEKGQLFSQLDILKQQFEIDVISAIANAAVHVRSNPRHTAPL